MTNTLRVFSNFMVSGLLLFCINLQAEDFDDEVVYSTEGYCLLANEGVASDYLRAYAKKLGVTPSKKVCRSFQEIVQESRPANWDYPQGRPYPGSVVRLTSAQVQLVKAINKTNE